jgi:type II secretory ATPase GspE/PulE/Tfp pilus assembly ATPase PilB-like protein
MGHDIKNLFLEEADNQTIMKTAREQQGMRTLLEDALLKCSKGITTEEEVWRVTLLETESWKGHDTKKR